MSDASDRNNHRRHFLQAAGGVMILKPGTVFGTQANSAIEIGLTGCGGRGPWVAGLFQEFVGARVVALHDPFEDRLNAARQSLKADSAKFYKGIRAFGDMASSKLDAIAIESPPYFHPEQAAAAIAAGKPVYMAKPMAVDVSGCKSILASGEKAKGRLSFWVDFQFRAKPVFQELVARIRRGDIGTPVVGHFYYHTGRLGRKDRPGMPVAEARLRNWVFDKVLSGDIIVEQNIHALDAGQWMLGTLPLRAFGTGGRKARVDVGDCWDHFVVTYWYPDDVKVDFSSSQCIKGYNDICARLYGSAGTAEGHYGGAAVITGEKPWKGAERDETGREGTIANIRTFTESLRTAKPVNNVEESIQSNLTAILGRMAAYRQTMVTWDEMMRSEEKLEANIDL